MARVDSEARQDAMKGLMVIFIITIALSSLGLLVKIFLKRTGAFTVRKSMIFFLTFGTLLYALFPLPLIARSIFNVYSVSQTCTTSVMSSVYMIFYFPFVYAMALLVLAVELYLGTTRSRWSNPSSIVKLIYAVVPWLLGIVIVLPTMLSGLDWNICRNGNGSEEAQIWVCCLIPTIAVLIVPAVFGFITSRRPRPPIGASAAYHHAPYNAGQHGRVEIAPPPKRPNPAHHQPYDYQSGPPPYHQNYGHQHQQYTFQMPAAPSYQTQYPTQSQPPPPNCAPPPPGFGPPCYDFNQAPPQAPSQQMQQPASVEAASIERPRDIAREVKALIVVSFTYFVCSFPHSVFNLAYLMSDYRDRMDRLPEAVINDTIHYLTIIRFLLLNIWWIVFLE